MSSPAAIICPVLIIFLSLTLPIYGQVTVKDSLTLDPDSTGRIKNKKILITGYPAAGYTPETSFQLGAAGIIVWNSTKKNFHHSRPSSVTPYFLVTFNKQFLSAIEYESFPANRLYVNSTIRYFNYPDQFYGLGNNTTGKFEIYTDQFIKLDGKFSRIVKNRYFIGITYEWQYNRLSNIKEGGMLDSSSVNGISGGNLLGIGPYFRLDTRNDIFYPSHGFFIETGLLFYPEINGSDYRFQSLLADFRIYTPVITSKNILAVQVYFGSAKGTSVPFYKLPRLGGDSRLRGIDHENRYRDENVFYIQAEGRKHLFWRISGVLFAGTGSVVNELSDFSWHSLKYVFGIGGRFQPFKTEKLNLRMDIGKGPGDQYGIYLSVKEAF